MFENTPHTDRPDNESTGKAALHKAAERVREGVKAAYPHAHFRHLSWAVLLAFVFFISTDSIEAVFSSRFFTNVYWWCVYVFFFGGCYFFCSPYLRNTLYTQALYINFHRGYVLWLGVAAMYHLPSFQAMGIDVRMNLSLFVTCFLASLGVFIVFHASFYGLWYLGIAPRPAGYRPNLWTLLQNSTVLSTACCLFYGHCGNRGPVVAERSQSLFSIIFNTVSHFDISWLKNPPVDVMRDKLCNSWFGPVGSAKDYPGFAKWVLYGEVLGHGTCFGDCDIISPVYSLWATFVGLYIANYVVERSSGWELTHPRSRRRTEPAPIFEDMVPWYSGTSADLFKTAFDLMVSVTLFLGRFDMRQMETSIQHTPELENNGFLYTHFSEKKEMWFDFMADTGDGGNSTYTIARLLAQPSLPLAWEGTTTVLPRGSLLVLGGDLAYPNPSPASYEDRLFRPFQYALQPPAHYRPEHVAYKKPELPSQVKRIQDYEGPQCFAIPGNHDWFDGLDTFMRYFCYKSWLGGWLLPQTKSYFALKLPQGWWIFCLDLSLVTDIDLLQFKYFAELAKNQVGPTDNVIVVTHEPDWLLDWYRGHASCKNVNHMIKDYLCGRCRVRFAGDLHFYMRSVSDHPHTADIEQLVCNGGGGAFLHPTHAFKGFKGIPGASYTTKGVYPPFEECRRLAFNNIWKFRKKNWRFDVIGGIMYYLLVVSLFPQCDLEHCFARESFLGHVKEFFKAVTGVVWHLLEASYISVWAMTALLLTLVCIVPARVSTKTQLLIGSLHAMAHVTASIILMLLLEIGIESMVRHGLLGSGGYHTLFEWYRSMESEHFPDPKGLRKRIEFWTMGMYPSAFKYMMSFFDLPEVMAVTRGAICKSGLNSVARSFTLLYYGTVFLYYWMFSTPMVSFVFGTYLYICINWLNLHFDEAFSSLRVSHWKSFTRVHVTEQGDLEVYTLGVDKVSKEWMQDPAWIEDNTVPSYKVEKPSQWIPVPPPLPDKRSPHNNSHVRIVDYFVVKKTRPEPPPTIPIYPPSDPAAVEPAVDPTEEDPQVAGLEALYEEQ